MLVVALVVVVEPPVPREETSMSETVTTPGSRVVDGRQVPEPGNWEIDPSHASFEFVARHLMARVRGHFSDVSGVAHIAERPEDSSLEVEIDTSTVDTRDPNRDAHLRSNDFFGTEEHPTITFRSTAVRPGAREDQWLVDGDLTIRGVTRPVTVDTEFLGAALDPWGNQRIGFSGVVPEVNREDWGLTWNTPLETGGFLLSKSVRLEIEAELVKKQ
jgi:polyisoprenoid-binding protein YceI